MKAQLQAKLARNKDQIGKSLTFGFLKCLPADTTEAPKNVQEFCFPGGQIPTMPWPLEAILSMAKEVPLRKTRKDVAASALPATMFQSLTPQCLALMQGFLMQGMAAMNPSFQQEVSLTMLRPQARQSQLSGLLDRARSNSSEFSQPSHPLALQDAPALPADSNKGTLALEEKDTEMKVELPESKAEAQPEKQQVEERPPASALVASNPPHVEPKSPTVSPPQQAAHVSLSESLRKMQHARGILKRPAAAPKTLPAMKKVNPQAKKKPVPMKKPASSLAGNKSLGKSELKEKLLKTIPTHLKAERRNGCSKRRWVKFCTVSCWAARGWTI